MEMQAKEDDEQDTYPMVQLKPPSAQNNNVPPLNMTTTSRVPRKITYKPGYVVRATDQTVAGSANPRNSNLQVNKGKKKRISEVADRRCLRLAPHLNKVAYDYQTSKRFRIKNGRRISEAHKLALKKAKELQENLSTEHPIFIKQILRSHVIGSFMLVVPVEFRSHLPTHSVDVILEDESGESYMVRYVPYRMGIDRRFIGGWKSFSVAHKLLRGDVVVFHLLRPCYFKVYIIRANCPKVAGSAKITNLDIRGNKGKKKRKCEVTDRNGPRLASLLDKVQESVGVAYGNDKTIKRGRIDSEACTLALERAKELQTNLSSEHPSFVKQMHSSNVVIRKALLILPMEFCRLHLPNHDAEFTLEDENGDSYIVKFLPSTKNRFSSGWIRYSAAHNLAEGDVLVFHLLRPCYFKVYIIRAKDSTIAGSATKGKKRKHAVGDRNGPRLTPHQDTVQESAGRSTLISNSDHQSSKEDPNSSDMEVSTLSGRVADFEKFKIIINNEVIDPELSGSIRFKYYKLCCSQKSYLHHQLLKIVDRTLAVGVIAGTVKVAETIRTCELYNASQDDFAMWDNTLEGLKRFGMDVGFLCDRLKRMVSLASEYGGKEEVKKYIEAKNKLECAEEKMTSIETEFLELKRSANELEDEMKTMKVNIEKGKYTFLEEAAAPW